MDAFETPYEDSVEINFIHCEICSKSIRGDTLYKIHVTTHGHLKNEDALVAEGKLVREHIVPEFEDISQYLDYLNLDEPIVGLEFLDEIPNESTETPGLKYTCTLCKVNSYLPDTVSHVIGRKHRQKYLEKMRPDLANWDPLRTQGISAKVLRAKAEVAARQAGRGKPKPLPYKTKMHPFTRFQGGQNNGQSSRFSQDLRPLLPNLRTQGPGRYFSDNPGYSSDPIDNNFGRQRPPRGESEMFSYMGTGERLDHYQSREGFGEVPGSYDEDRRPFSSNFRKPELQNDPLKEFYTEELKREQMAKAQLQPPAPCFGDDQWHHDMEPQRRDVRLGREGELEASRSGFSTSLDPKNSQEIFRMIKDYRHNVLGSGIREDAPGPSKISPSRSGDMSRKMSDIPDPFMRFLQGGNNQEEPAARKRKSRFSDATVEEVQAAQEIFDESGPTKPKFPSMRPDHPPQQAEPHKGLEPKERFQREPLPEQSEGTGNVFEMLSSIQIENEEEANFLKERLCNVLREFKAWKMEKMAQTSQGRTVIVKEYNNRPITEHKQEGYDRVPRENPDLGGAEDPYNNPSELEGHEAIMDEGFTEYQHPPFPETRRPNMNPFREPKMWPIGKPPRPGFDKPSHFPGKFQDPLRPRDYLSTDDFGDYSSRPRLPMDRGPRTQRPPQYSRNLDKITSTLLELVARK